MNSKLFSVYLLRSFYITVTVNFSCTKVFTTEIGYILHHLQEMKPESKTVF